MKPELISEEEFTHIQETLDEEIQVYIKRQQEAKKAGRPGARPYVGAILRIAESVAARYGLEPTDLNF